MRLRNLGAAVGVLALGTILTSAQEGVKTLNGGVVNGKAISLAKPVYPDLARKANVEGAVRVEVIINENGDVEAAVAVKDNTSDGDFLATEVSDAWAAMRSAAEAAALQSKFSPTLLSGAPVKVRGVIVYNFSMKPAASATGKILDGGILNSRASELPNAAYPAAALAVRASGVVVVNVVIDEGGNVIEAAAVSGHPLLRSAAVAAARKARFEPTMLNGQPVRISGQLTYAFVLDEKQQ